MGQIYYHLNPEIMKTLIASIVIVTMTYMSNAQNVNIPDTAFLHALIEYGVDINGDGLISYTEAEAVNGLDVSENSITNMTGIEAFVNLETLVCGRNQFTSLDVSYCKNLINLDLSAYCSYPGCWDGTIATLDISKNTELEILNCSGNSLTSLDVSNNTALLELRCVDTKLTSLNVSNNNALAKLICWNNQLTSLDLSNNTALVELDLCFNQLTSLDVSNNTSLYFFDMRGMTSLFEVCVWDDFSIANQGVDTSGSPNVYFTTDCSTSALTNSAKNNTITIYPNPASKIVTISSSNEMAIHQVNIYNQIGQLVLQEQGRYKTVDVGALNPGLYIVEVISDQSRSSAKLLIE